jgi:hypothetical protein
MSNPRPGTKISTPVFGYELFVAHDKSLFLDSQKQGGLIHNSIFASAHFPHSLPAEALRHGAMLARGRTRG